MGEGALGNDHLDVLDLADAIHIGCQLEGPPNGGRQFGSRLPNLWSTVVARAAATQRVTYQEFFLIGAIARTGKATAALAASRVMRDRVDARRTPLDIGHSPKCLLFIAHRCKFLKLSLAHLCLLDRSVGSRFDSRCAVRISFGIGPGFPSAHRMLPQPTQPLHSETAVSKGASKDRQQKRSMPEH